MIYFKYINICVISCLLFISCQKNSTKNTENTLPYFNSYDLTPLWGKEHKVHRIAPFKFINQKGDSISQQEYFGKIYVANFFFTSCTGICNELIKNMSILQQKLEKDSLVHFVSHSVTPKIDSVSKLQQYISYKNIDTRNWDFITGNKDEIYTLARKSYFADVDYKKTKQPSSFIHSENFLLIDPEGYIRGIYNGTLKLEMTRIVKHIAILEREFYIK